ncbi:MAG: hypothetical protein WAM65_10500, partial [Candidatus Korobacteraceae bacterium]
IKNEENCLLIDNGHSDSQHVWTGRGAGRWPTTAAVMADLFDLYREQRAAAGEQWSAVSKKAIPPQLATDNWQLATDFGGVA